MNDRDVRLGLYELQRRVEALENGQVQARVMRVGYPMAMVSEIVFVRFGLGDENEPAIVCKAGGNIYIRVGGADGEDSQVVTYSSIKTVDLTPDAPTDTFTVSDLSVVIGLFLNGVRMAEETSGTPSPGYYYQDGNTLTSGLTVQTDDSLIMVYL